MYDGVQMFYCVLFLLLSGCSGVVYDQIKAIKMYMGALAAYCGPEVVLSWSCGPCRKAYDLTNVEWLNSSDPTRASAFIATINELGAIVVVFRGNPALELTHNTSLFTSERAPFDASCTVSQYFRDGYEMLRESLFKMVGNYTQVYREAYPNIVVVGFSLGGALASLAAADLKEKGKYNVVGIYTYGDPRVGDQVFAYWFNGLGIGETIRVVNSKDKVPFLLGNGYRHHWTEVFYYRELFSHTSHWKVCAQGDKEDASCSAQYYGFQRKLDDHFTYFGMDFGEAIAKCDPANDKTKLKAGNLKK